MNAINRTTCVIAVCFLWWSSNSMGANPDLPYPYNTVELLPFDGSGHFGKPQANGLSFVIKKYKPKVVVEIGSYLGASTRHIAKLLPDDGVVIAVDHWLGNTEWHHEVNFAERQALFYQKFLSNVIHTKLCHKIIPMRMPSSQAAKNIEIVPDLAYIDGSHDYESVYEDICAWFNVLGEEGVLCGDDYNWGASKQVKKAVDQFAKEHNLTVKLIENWFWYYEKN